MDRLIIPCILVAIIGFIVGLTIKESREWESFKVENNCKVVANIRASMATAIASNGAVSIVDIPKKTGWLCDNGITYYR